MFSDCNVFKELLCETPVLFENLYCVNRCLEVGRSKYPRVKLKFCCLDTCK